MSEPHYASLHLHRSINIIFVEPDSLIANKLGLQFTA